MFQIANGTKEIIVVDMTDKTGAVTDLSGLSPTFTVEYHDGTVIVNAAAATATLMRILCLINTTTGGPWLDGAYKLFIGFTVGTEIPKVFASDFYLI